MALFERLSWFGLAVLIALVSAIPFDRFDPSRHRARLQKLKPKPRKRRLFRRGKEPEPVVLASSAEEPTPALDDIQLTALKLPCTQGRFLSLVRAEFLLLIKGRSWWWHAVALGLAVACIAAPLRVVQTFIIPLVWIWPMFIWSVIGNRERQNQTERLIFSTARLVSRQLPALWLAGVLLAVIVTSGALLRMGISGQWQQLPGWLVGIAFVPALALAIGTWTSSPRLFEIVYAVWWFMGVLSQMVPMDFLGRTDQSVGALMPVYYAVLTIAFLVLAAAGRRKQIVAIR